MHLVLFAATLAQWIPAGPWGGPAGYLSVDRQNPNRLIACSRNGNVFISADAARHWVRLPFPRLSAASIEVLKIHPQRSNLFLAGVTDETGEHAGLYESTDGGYKWERNPSLKNEAVFSMAFFPGDTAVIAAGTRSGVYLSQDFGKTWASITRNAEARPMPVVSLAFDPNDRNILYAGTTHLAWKTTDGGASWKSIHQGMLDDSDVFSIHVNSANPERIYASACSGIYASDDRGEPWRKAQGIPGTDRRTHVIIADPEYPNLLLAGTTAGLWKSADAGQTWRKMNDYFIRSLEYDPKDSRVLYMATADRGLMKSTTAGIEFQEVNNGYVGRPMLRVLFPGDGSLLALALRTDGRAGLFRRKAGGSDWKPEDTGPAGISDAVWFHRALFTRTNRGLMRRNAEGKWAKVSLPGDAEPTTIEASKDILWAGTPSGLFRTADGTKWVPVALPVEKASIYEIFPQGTAAIIRTTKGLLVSNPQGTRWSAITAPDGGRVFQFALQPGNPQALFAATSSGLMKSMDQGRSWVQLAGGLPQGFIYSITSHPLRPKEWFATQMGRVFRSIDDGISWREMPDMLESALMKRLFFDTAQPDEIFALTEGQGIFSSRILP